jgi:hypothetical protein
MHYQFVASISIPNSPRGCKVELLWGGRFLAVFRALCNQEYFDSDHKMGSFGKEGTKES